MTGLTRMMTKSFMKGLTSFMVIWPEPVPVPDASPMTDAKKIASDWMAVGKDLRLACNRYEREYGKK